MKYHTCPKCGEHYARSDLARWQHVCSSEAERSQSSWLRYAKRALAARDATDALHDAEALFDFAAQRANAGSARRLNT
ncbi:MAG TPA: hypothetical protein VFG38_11005 [Pseudomonadales bacterium]|nr:hypothetical protein [Pseudomonadales bacterium]